MSVNPRRLSSGKVIYDVRLRGPEGRNYKRSFPTKREAMLFEEEERTARARGGWVDPRAGQLPLQDYTARWMEQRVNLRSRSRELYEGLLRLHILPTLGKIDIADLTPSLIRAWHTDLVRSGKPGRPTVAKAYRLRRLALPPLPRSATHRQHVGRNERGQHEGAHGRLGHSSPQAALRYQHATAERDAAIAEFLDGVIRRGREDPGQGIER